MKFKVKYKVFSIPNDIIDMGQDFAFTYTAKKYELGDISHYLNLYLQQFFTKGNYEILSIERVKEGGSK